MEGWRWCWKIWNRKLPNCQCLGVGDGVQESGLKAPIRLHPYPQSFTYQSCIPTKDSQFCSCCSDFSWPILHFKKNCMFFFSKILDFLTIFTVSNFSQIFLKISQVFLNFFSIFFSKILDFFPKNSQKNLKILKNHFSQKFSKTLLAAERSIFENF